MGKFKKKEKKKDVLWLINKLEEMYTWLESFGVRVSPSRIGQYRKGLKQLLDNGKTTDKDVHSNFIWIIYEILELCQIFDCYKSSHISNRLRLHLQEICSGPAFYENENVSSTNRARNLAFELLLASRLIKGGAFAEVTFPSDLLCKFGETNIFIECKRPQYESNIINNIKEADSQLRQRYKTAFSEQNRGIIAIDLTKCFFPKKQFTGYEDSNKIEQIIEKALEQFANRFVNEIDKSRHPKTIGLVMRLTHIIRSNDADHNLQYFQYHDYVAFGSLPVNDLDLSKKIGTIF